jgi:hypothetical protein
MTKTGPNDAIHLVWALGDEIYVDPSEIRLNGLFSHRFCTFVGSHR